MSSWVLDASALLALLNQEAGSQPVADAITDGSAISAVNLAEVVSKLDESGMPEAIVHQVLDPLGLDIIDFDVELVYRTGMLRALTRSAGLSLGDRACLALARQLDLPVLTADRTWVSLPTGNQVPAIR